MQTLKQDQLRSHSKVIPGPGLLGLSEVLSLKAHMLQDLRKWSKAYGPLFRFRIGPMRFVIISHPDHVENLLLKNENVLKKGKIHKILYPLLGEGLDTSSGELWKKQRKLIQPLFNRPNIMKMYETMIKRVDYTLSTLDGEICTNELFSKLTLDVASATLFGDQFDESDRDRLVREFQIATECLFEKVLMPLPDWMPTANNRELKRSICEIDEVIYRQIELKRNSKSASFDLLSRLIQAEDPETGEKIESDKQIRDEVTTMIQGAHDTLSLALSWTIHYLAQAPSWADQIRRECEKICKNPSTPSFEENSELKITRAVIDEILRLHPPGWGIPKEMNRDHLIDGYELKKGDNLVVSPALTQRMEKFWSSPNEFKPERWLRGKPYSHRAAYYPFSLGQRNCLGQFFALYEGTLILAALCSRFDFHSTSGTIPKEESFMTLSPTSPAPVTFSKRV